MLFKFVGFSLEAYGLQPSSALIQSSSTLIHFGKKDCCFFSFLYREESCDKINPDSGQQERSKITEL